MTTPVRVLLADDENLIRAALVQLLGLEPDLAVVAEAATGDEALAMAVKHAVDVAVLDLQMPGPDGIAVAERLADLLPGCGVVIVTSHGRPGHLKRALGAGVRGFLPKTTSAASTRPSASPPERPACSASSREPIGASSSVTARRCSA